MKLLDDQMRDLVREEARAIVREELERHLEAIRDAEGPGRLITTQEAARLIGRSPKTIRRWVRNGRLHRYGASRNIRVSERELLRRRDDADDDVEAMVNDTVIRLASRR